MIFKLAVAALLTAFLADQGETVTVGENGLYEVETQILDRTNAQREKYGLPPLALDKKLLQSARTHTAWMTNARNLQHTSKAVGENIAMGQRSTDEAVNAWMSSPGHRANILNRSYKRMGMAAYRTPGGTIYWCQQFLP